jgi:hypothetical protein
MGNLTDDMTRLRGEVDALRGARGAMMNNLTRGARDLTMAVAAMRADFTSAHTAMAKKTGKERETFVDAVIAEVNSLLGEFSRDRNDMARKGRDDRRTFLSKMRRQVTGLCKETANDLMGARLAWRGERPGESRPVTMKKPVVVKPIPSPLKPVLKKAVAAPEIKAAKPPVTFKEPLKKEEEKKTVVAAPETKAEKAPVTFKEPLKKEEEKKTVVAAPKAHPAVIPSKFKTPETVVKPMPFQKSKEKSWLDEKPATKAATRAKRGRK